MRRGGEACPVGLPVGVQAVGEVVREPRAVPERRPVRGHGVRDERARRAHDLVSLLDLVYLDPVFVLQDARPQEQARGVDAHRAAVALGQARDELAYLGEVVVAGVLRRAVVDPLVEVVHPAVLLVRDDREGVAAHRSVDREREGLGEVDVAADLGARLEVARPETLVRLVLDGEAVEDVALEIPLGELPALLLDVLHSDPRREGELSPDPPVVYGIAVCGAPPPAVRRRVLEHRDYVLGPLDPVPEKAAARTGGRRDGHDEGVLDVPHAGDDRVPDGGVLPDVELVGDEEVEVPGLQRAFGVGEDLDHRAVLAVLDLDLPNVPQGAQVVVLPDHHAERREDLARLGLRVGDDAVLAHRHGVDPGLGEQHRADELGLSEIARQADERRLVAPDEAPVLALADHPPRPEDGAPDVVALKRLEEEGLPEVLGLVSRVLDVRRAVVLAQRRLVIPGLRDRMPLAAEHPTPWPSGNARSPRSSSSARRPAWTSSWPARGRRGRARSARC